MAKSLIASHNASNNSANDMNKKHNNIVNQLQAWFPSKEKHQVIKLYVELVVEMMRQPGQSGNQSMVAVNNLVNDNYGIPVEDSTMNNMNMPLASLTGKKPEAMRVVEEAPQRQVIIPQQERRHKRLCWTTEEHRLIILDISLSLHAHVIFNFERKIMTHNFCGLKYLLRMWCGVFIIIMCRDSDKIDINKRGDPRICTASIDILNIFCIFYLIIIYKLKSFSSHVTCFSNQECFSAASIL